jgi:hypothetical protein
VFDQPARVSSASGTVVVLEPPLKRGLESGIGVELLRLNCCVKSDPSAPPPPKAVLPTCPRWCRCRKAVQGGQARLTERIAHGARHHLREIHDHHAHAELDFARALQGLLAALGRDAGAR